MSESIDAPKMPPLPTGVSQSDLARAQEYQAWKVIDNKVASGRVGNDEMAQWRNVPRVAGRPAWVSMLSEQEREGFEKAGKWLVEQQQPKKK